MKVETAGVPATSVTTKLRYVMAFPSPRRLVSGPLRRTLRFNAVPPHRVLWGAKIYSGGIFLRVFQSPPPPISIIPPIPHTLPVIYHACYVALIVCAFCKTHGVTSQNTKFINNAQRFPTARLYLKCFYNI